MSTTALIRRDLVTVIHSSLAGELIVISCGRTRVPELGERGR